MSAPGFSPSSLAADSTWHNVLSRRLIFVSGKGGVGKTLVSRAIARALPGKILWVCFEDPARPPQEQRRVKSDPSGTLDELNCESARCFQEYIGMKIGVPALAKIFLQSKLIQYLAQAAPGIRELVLLGKVWFERERFDHIVCDMPSTGHGLAMFQSMGNFSALFGGGPLARDAESMITTFSDPRQTGHLIVSLPEEMPLVESLELRDTLATIFPGNEPRFLVNRLIPGELATQLATSVGHPDDWPTPVAESLEDYLRKRWVLERENVQIWERQGIRFGSLPFFPPPADGAAPDATLLDAATRFIASLVTAGRGGAS